MSPDRHVRVLAVDDDDAVLRMVSSILTHDGFSVHTARTGSDALVFLRDHAGEVDLLLTDVVMPGMGGVELAAWAREMVPGLKVLFMTGFAGTVTPDGPVVEKPFHPADLTAKIVQIMGPARKAPIREPGGRSAPGDARPA